jgi:hypothetical protein
MPKHFFQGTNASNLAGSRSPINVTDSVLGLQTFEHDLCLIKQVNILTLFYFINIFIEVFENFLGNDSIEAGALLCANQNYLIVHNEIGGIFMWFYSANIMISSLVMQIVFYHLPVKYNLVAFSKFGQ